MLRVRDLHFSYGAVPVLNGISFHVREGELCGLFGPNGSGKTTLFKCCLNFLKLKQGTVHMCGRDVSKLSIREMAKIVTYVPQEHKPPFPYLVNEIVLMGRTPHLGGIFGIPHRDRMIAIDALDTLGIADLAERPYSQLSGGQRQMVLMARSIAQDTPLMFLDEPTSALDFQNQMRIWKIMRKIVESGRTIIACSHDPNHVAWFCDRVIVVGNSGVIADGDPAEVINEQTLGQIYHNTCTVQTVEGVRIVMPAGLQTWKNGKNHLNTCNQHVGQNTIRRIDYDIGHDKLEL
ncbi:iron ABC transporter [Methanosarcina sp. 2.H.T.1A.6]|uniref:ABC transporter ATP-binding protein n=1 Tax=unclassified Methanosarcina TaxID=2644672 RepID=UPI000621EECE|nr:MULTISPECIES: ABC transporter ATP-binding protein [unclassified Methanosarcina]KKG14671.1 iron ABC transporter [Methanosarcina sp. 2.H.T.1A.3]KKG22177.1 iron ABC transporter [Methanosarcina sp. 2.H.T.1A.8]KKG24541.1 iron ABC transporter [Methanosarcina sp. 2.H.T.1A.6]KKG25706.1 iron ABC transporter [Methanosarcina sp. 2.H.T.1A.15]